MEGKGKGSGSRDAESAACSSHTGSAVPEEDLGICVHLIKGEDANIFFL